MACLYVYSLAEDISPLWLTQVLNHKKTVSSMDVATATNQRIEVNPLHMLVPLLIASIIGEWIFREKLTDFFRENLSNLESILFANGVFAFVHLDWFFFPYFINGCLYAWSYKKTKDLKVPMLAHILYNLFVFLVTSFLLL